MHGGSYLSSRVGHENMSHEGWGPSSGRGDTQTTPSFDQRRVRSQTKAEHWWLLNRTIRFYGVVLLAGTKLADAVTTAVGVMAVPGIVELNPIASAVFAGKGTLTGLAVLSFVTVAVATVTAEWLAILIRRRFDMPRLALLAKGTIYGSLSLLFGAIAVNNALLISGQVEAYLSELLVFTAILS